jgi:hypothetical protein
MLLILLPEGVVAAQIRLVMAAVWVAIVWAFWRDYLSRPAARLRWRVRRRLSHLFPVLIPVHRKEPTMGYLNRVIHLDFPDLAGTAGEPERSIVWVKIKNPKLLVGNDVFADVNTIELDSDGKPSGSVKQEEVYRTFSKLVIAGYVWDATDDTDDPPLIPMPPTPADMGKMPIEILNAIGAELLKTRPK